jgi:hypothetical protein
VVPASASPKATLAHVVAAEPTIARYVRDLERVRPPRAAAHEYATFVAEQRAFLVRLRRAVADLKAHRLNAGRLLLIEEVGAARISGAQALALRLPACAKTSQALG